MLQILKLLNYGHFFWNYDQLFELFGIMVKSMELCNIEKNPLNFGQR